ncbi:metallophosphoesterase family protein [Breznakia sp. OttesenSCG-928-G09]|nr:metallophosphoesterase family protein [Breznakia sp. OttesenSCG-928-G09]
MKKLRNLFIALVIGITCFISVPNELSAASNLYIGNVNTTYVGDSSTSIQINFKTAKLSRKDTQPVVDIYYYPTGAKAEEKKIAATATVESYTSYHVAYLEGLKKDTAYTYYAKNRNDNSVSKEYIFKTTGDEVNFIALSNAHYRSTSSYQNNYVNTYNAAIERTGADFIIHTGKLASGTSESYLNGYYDMFNSDYPLLHNTDQKSSANKYFALNHSATKAQKDSSDSYVVVGNTLILNVNTTLNSSTDIKNHIAWLRNTVANNKNCKWIVVSMSDSFYGNSISTSTIKKQLTPVFDELGVNAVLQGKETYYARSYLVKNDMVLDDYPQKSAFAKKDGLLYISPGVAGAEQTDPSSGRTWLSKTTSYKNEAKAAGAKTYTNIKANDNELTFTTYRVDGNVVDTYKIYDGETPERGIETFEPIGLNNAFVKQATDNRTFTWQSNSTFAEPYIRYATVDQDLATQGIETRGSSAKTSIYLTSYNANKVSLNGLKPNTTYQYRVGNIVTNAKTGSKTKFESEVYTFTTDDTNTKDFSFVHFSDSQGGSSEYNAYWGNTARKAKALVPDAALYIHTGDMVESMSKSHWDGFLTSFGNSFTTGAFMPVLGNHEGKTSEALYPQIFSPVNENGYALNYSYTYGNALFININSNYDSTRELEKQATWIRNTVSTYGKDKFIVVSFHKGPFGGRWALGHGDTGLGSGNIKKILVPVFEECGVSLVLQGHDHNYLRSYPIKNSAPNTKVDNRSEISTSQDGTIYMVSRNSGEKTYDMYDNRAWIDVSWNPGAMKKSPDATVFSKIDVKDDRMIVTVYTSTYQIIDSYTITK